MLMNSRLDEKKLGVDVVFSKGTVKISIGWLGMSMLRVENWVDHSSKNSVLAKYDNRKTFNNPVFSTLTKLFKSAMRQFISKHSGILSYFFNISKHFARSESIG